MYRCVDCGHIFEAGEEHTYKEDHGEKFSCCPVCGGDFVEADHCDGCRKVKYLDELYSGYCVKCLKKSLNGTNVSHFIKETEQAEDFYVKWFYETECLSVSNELIDLCRTGYLRQVALEAMKGEYKAIREFWRYLDNTAQINVYAKWLAGMGKQDKNRR